MNPLPSNYLEGAARLDWLGFRRAFGSPGSCWTVTRGTGINSPAACILKSVNRHRITVVYTELGESDLTHFSHNTYYRTITGTLVVCFPGLADKPPGWVAYTPNPFIDPPTSAPA